MNLDELVLEALAWLLTYAVHSSVLLFLAWLVTTVLLRRERSRELAWKLALVGGIATASVQCFLALEPHSGAIAIDRGPSAAALARREPQLATSVTKGGAAEVSPAGELRQEFAPRIEQSALEAVGSIHQEEFAAGWQSLPATFAGAPVDWRKGLIALWIVGGSALALLFALAAARLHDRLSGRECIRAGPLFADLAALRRQAHIRRPVRLMLSPKLRTPVALGTLFPEICLPPRALQELSPDEQRAMLAHELAHIARFDPTWLSICRWVETLFFFQPLNRLARRRIDHAAELLCDAQALRWTADHLGLARCLANVAGWLLGERERALACGMAGSRSRLTERVTRILQNEPEPPAVSPYLAPCGGLALAATVLFAPGFASQRAIAPRTGPEALPAAPADVPRSRNADAIPTAKPARQAPLRAVLQRVHQELAHEFAALDAELAELRTEMQRAESVPAGVEERFTTIQTRLSALQLKKAQIDALVSQWLSLQTENTTIDVMDRSH